MSGNREHTQVSTTTTLELPNGLSLRTDSNLPHPTPCSSPPTLPHSSTARDDDEDAQPLLASSPRPAPPHAATPYLALLAHAAAAALLTFGLKSALVHFCEVSAPSRVMATMTVKWALMLPCAAFVAWFLWRYARGGGSPWTQSCDCRTVRVPAKMWAGAYLAAWAAYYALYLADDKDTFPSPELSRPRACLWNLLLCLGLGAAAHVAVDARNVLPALVMALAVPFATPDRVPYSVEPSGCPNPIHHAVGAYALVSARERGRGLLITENVHRPRRRRQLIEQLDSSS